MRIRMFLYQVLLSSPVWVQSIYFRVAKKWRKLGRQIEARQIRHTSGYVFRTWLAAPANSGMSNEEKRRWLATKILLEYPEIQDLVSANDVERRLDLNDLGLSYYRVYRLARWRSNNPSKVTCPHCGERSVGMLVQRSCCICGEPTCKQCMVAVVHKDDAAILFMHGDCIPDASYMPIR